MILQALTRYYNILADDPSNDIPRSGYSIEQVSWALNLSPQGELLDIFSLFEEVPGGKGMKERPRRMLVPEHVKRSCGIIANFLCDNATYVLGLSGREPDDPKYVQQRFQVFRQFNKELLAQANCVEAKAVLAFLEGYDPSQGRENPIIVRYLEDLLKGGNLVFKLDGSEGFVHQHPEVRQVWENYKASKVSEYVGQCLVTGEQAPIARVHTNVKGIPGTQPSGAALVGFNARAYESYNRTKAQGLNSPVSEQAAFAYTTVLNYLLSPTYKNKKLVIGDTAVVYWAESKDRVYADLIEGLFLTDWEEAESDRIGVPSGRDPAAEQRLKDIANKIRQAKEIDTEELLEGLNPNTSFYVLGLAGNTARVSVRFFHTDPFLKIVEKVISHYKDLQIIKENDRQPDFISVSRMIFETIPKKSSDRNPNPLLGGSVFRSILNNSPYPAALYYAILNRIHAEMDDRNRQITKINYVRAAIIKAYLIRKYRNQDQPRIKEVLSMALNKQSTNQAYLLGRLFAVLEKAQQDAAAPTKLDATIKDRYFTSACASPASVFPILLRLSQHHISKSEYGHVSDKRIEEIMNLLDVDKQPIPARLTLDEQGVFVLGYYHQRAAFYESKERSKDIEQSVSE